MKSWNFLPFVLVILVGCATEPERRLTVVENKGTVWERANQSPPNTFWPAWFHANPDADRDYEYRGWEKYAPVPVFR